MIIARGWNLPTAPDAITGPTAATEGDMTMGAPIVMGASMANEATVAPNLIILVTNISFRSASVLIAWTAARRLRFLDADEVELRTGRPDD